MHSAASSPSTDLNDKAAAADVDDDVAPLLRSSGSITRHAAMAELGSASKKSSSSAAKLAYLQGAAVVSTHKHTAAVKTSLKPNAGWTHARRRVGT